MAEKVAGVLEVGTNGNGEVIVNHPDLKPDENGVGHIVFSARQARQFARLLLKHADAAWHEEKLLSHPVQQQTVGG
jgi:hypothetical protein